jgi:REP element-mobilizing transposase RayT
MARKLRLEFPGAVYHVINRGNYRADIFANDKAKGAFEECLFQACRKSGWILHAFVLMRNHFHLSLETPEGNLVPGMQWLQGTFGCRFNRFRQEHGHLFQGRYKALIVGDGPALGSVGDYIHLNPVRAGVVQIEDLRNYRYSSYWYLRNPNRRPDFLHPETALASAGGLPDKQAGWDRYELMLEQQVDDGSTGQSRTCVNLSKGWVIGTKDFKAALISEYKLAGLTRAWGRSGAAEVRAEKWRAALQEAMALLQRTPDEAMLARKSAPWKLAIAAWMKTHTQAGNGWLSKSLNLGAPKAFSHNLTHFRRTSLASDPHWKKLSALSVT